MMPTELLSPGVFQMLAALLVPLIAAGLWRNVYMAGIPVVAFGGRSGLLRVTTLPLNYLISR